MPLNSFPEVQAFITQVMTDLGFDATFAPHDNFWSTLSYEQFVDGNVPGINPAMKILIKGDSSQSAIVQALRGQGPFAPGKTYPRMPYGGPPFFSDLQIKEIADWIDAGCPR